MAMPYEERNSAVKTRRQQEDQRRMEFRRAIEDRCERRQLAIFRSWNSTSGRQLPRLPVETLNQRADLNPFTTDKRQEGVSHR